MDFRTTRLSLDDYDETGGGGVVTTAKQAQQATGCAAASIRLVRIAEPVWRSAEGREAAAYGAGRNAVSRVRSSVQR